MTWPTGRTDAPLADAVELPVIAAARVVLRPVAERDLAALLALFSHSEVMRYWAHPPLDDAADARELLAEIRKGFADRSLFQWAVALREGDALVGTTTLMNFAGESRRAEIGYALARERWGSGLMREALSALFDFAFSTLDLNRIEADVDPRNVRSLRLLEALGFRREGVMRQRWIVAGEVQDSVVLGLLRGERAR